MHIEPSTRHLNYILKKSQKSLVVIFIIIIITTSNLSTKRIIPIENENKTDAHN